MPDDLLTIQYHPHCRFADAWVSATPIYLVVCVVFFVFHFMKLN